MLQRKEKAVRSGLKRGDTVMIIAGGNKIKRAHKGKTGKIVRFVGVQRDRAILEGFNIFTRHTRANMPGKPSGKVPHEVGIHVSNLMFYVEKLKRPVRIKHKVLADGSKVRGYFDPKNRDFIQISEEAK